MRFKIPDDLRCSRCTLQWYWSSGKSSYYDGDYFDNYRGLASLGWDAAAWQPQILEPWANCANSCCQTGGPFGEEFWNCVDISVGSGRWHLANINTRAVNHKNCHINYQPGYHKTRPVHNVAKSLLRGLGSMRRSELGWANLL